MMTCCTETHCRRTLHSMQCAQLATTLAARLPWSLGLAPIQINPIYTLSPYLCEIRFSIIVKRG